ncbi:MAG: hypothetical protein A6F71_10925 [Cycloclasticus sp. symbiont of Poecilosclerida sp. M]|nr:MAG: hypothetical protein A6F71_10925 [Cycloclasticus sp. symbiont of Poecilosclerida sp. M]
MDNPNTDSTMCIILMSNPAGKLHGYIIDQSYNLSDPHTVSLMVTLSGSGGAQVAGEDYTLTCQFTGGEAVTPAYRWFKDDSPHAMAVMRS